MSSSCCIEATREASSPVGGSAATSGTTVVVGARVVVTAATLVVGATVDAGAAGTVVVAGMATGETSNCGAAAAWPPSRVGIDRESAHPALSMISTMAAPKARLRAGTAASQREWRTGSSTNRNESADSPTEMTTAAARWVQSSGPQPASASTRTGQCQRYNA